MKKAVIYIRDLNNHKERLVKQEQVCREHAARYGYTVVGLYVDTTSTGLDKQPYFWKMLKDAKERAFKFVIANSFDRVARRNLIEVKHRVIKSGLKIVSPKFDNARELQFLKEVELEIEVTLRSKVKLWKKQ